MTAEPYPDGIPHTHVRYYHQPPEEKSLEQCESHGRDHNAYQWRLQIDPRWSAEQRIAYIKGYQSKVVTTS